MFAGNFLRRVQRCGCLSMAEDGVATRSVSFSKDALREPQGDASARPEGDAARLSATGR